MNSSTRSLLGVLLILVITFCTTFVVSRVMASFGGFDLTEAKLYTLNEGTLSIIDKLPQPLTIKLFYSKEGVNKTGSDGPLLDFNNYYYYVRDLLRAYQRHGGGKIIFAEFDPKAFSDAEAEADRLRMRRVPLGEREGFYFGIAITSESGAEEVLPFLYLSQQARVEYKVSEAIELASQRRKTNIGLLSPLPMLGSQESAEIKEYLRMLNKPVPPGPWLICQALRRSYNIQRLSLHVTEISADLDYLLIVHPKITSFRPLSDGTLYAIDQFVLRGGKVMVFVDPYSYSDEHSRTDNVFNVMEHQRDSNMRMLLANWGLDFETRVGEDCLVAGDMTFAGRVNDPSNNVSGLTRFPGYMLITSEQGCLNQASVVTQGLEMVTMFIAGAFKKRADATTDIEILISTTDKGNTWPVNTFELADINGVDVSRLTNRFVEGGERLILAAEITGKVKSAFPDGPPAAEDDLDPEVRPRQHLSESLGSIGVIVVADVDMLRDDIAFHHVGSTYQNSNQDFVLNAIDHLRGSNDLIKIRSRGNFRRPFDVVSQIEEEADRKSITQKQEIEDRKLEINRELAALRARASQDNLAFLLSEEIDKQRALEAENRDMVRRQRKVEQEKVAAIESLGSMVKNINMILVPGVILLIGIGLAIFRNRRRRALVLGGVS